ncbi:MAG: PAS domain S-box protein, partial [candidate division Zixibacteria bacterium]|nr:PAS domain S-box protein [candidate division Zixibacteria bacterium]
MKKGKISGSDNITLLLLPRFITFLFLFGGSMFLLQSPRFIFELLVLYATAAFAYLALLLIKKDPERIFLRRALFFHILLEVIIAGIMIYHSGGYSSPLILLYILSIASASMIFQIRGALSISLAASVSYIVSIYLHIEKLFWGTSNGSLKVIFYEHADLFFSVSINIVLFTIVALISGFVAQRLKDRGDLLKTTEEELKRAHLVTADILDGMYSGLICIDRSLEILILNRAAKELLGLNPNQRFAGTIKERFTGGLKPFADFLMEAALNPNMLQRTELTIQTANEEDIPIAVNTSPLSGSDGKPRGLIAVFHDLTEFKELQEQLRLKDQLAAVGQLSAGIAHEIRNPLTSISGSVEILRDELELNEINQRLMDVIVKESGRL